MITVVIARHIHRQGLHVNEGQLRILPTTDHGLGLLALGCLAVHAWFERTR